MNHEGLGHVQFCYSKHHAGMEVQAWSLAINKSLIILEQSPNSQSHFLTVHLFRNTYRFLIFVLCFLFFFQNWLCTLQTLIEIAAECLTKKWGI